jgi:hypothetical protein
MSTTLERSIYAMHNITKDRQQDLSTITQIPEVPKIRRPNALMNSIEKT